MSEATTCKSCGNAVVDHYCSACGEKVLTPEDHTLKHYFGALLNAFTFADNKLWNTLKAVVLRPGELSAAYMEGRRMKYMRPVAIFFLANFIYFAAPILQTFNTTLYGQMYFMPHSSWVKEKVEGHLASTGQSMEAYSARYDPASASNAKLLLVVMVFLLVIPVALLYIRKKAFISAYVTASFEMMAFHLWVSTILLGVVSFGAVVLVRFLGGSIEQLMSDTYLTVPLLLLHFWVTIGLGHRFFGCSWPGAIWRSVALLFGFHYALTGYRMMLFAVTFWSVT